MTLKHAPIDPAVAPQTQAWFSEVTRRSAKLRTDVDTVTADLASMTLGVKVYAPCTVAQLPAVATAGMGARGFVTNSLSATFNAAVVAGSPGSPVPVFCDGSAWKVG